MIWIITWEDVESTHTLLNESMHFCFCFFSAMQEQRHWQAVKLAVSKWSQSPKLTEWKLKKGDRNGGQWETGHCDTNVLWLQCHQSTQDQNLQISSPSWLLHCYMRLSRSLDTAFILIPATHLWSPWSRLCVVCRQTERQTNTSQITQNFFVSSHTQTLKVKTSWQSQLVAMQHHKIQKCNQYFTIETR